MSEAEGLRGGDHHEFGVGQRLGHGNRHVAGAGSQVEQEDVRLAPPYVRQDLCLGALQARPTPQNRPVSTGEHADGDQFHAPRGDRHEHAIQIGGLCMHAEQARQ